MQKFRMLLDSKLGDHLSNAMGPIEAVCAADHVHLLTGREPEIILDTRSLRRELQAVDEKAAKLRASKSPQPGEFPLAIIWNRAIAMAAVTDCNCDKCKAVREAAASSKAAGLVVSEQVEAVKKENAAAAEIEHPYFAAPPLKHGMATIEEEDETPTVPLPVVASARQPPTLVSRICDLVVWFFGVGAGL